MAARSGHGLRERLAGGSPVSSTLAVRLDRFTATVEATMFGDVPDAVRFQMKLVACASESPEAALPEVVALVVPDDDPARRMAIVEAIRSNVALCEQWKRTWEVLRR